jgi:short-subunit dehydrogenase
LVNNAGVDVYGYFYDTDWTQELEMIQLNLVSLTHLTKLLLADMRQQGFGRILNLGSTGSFVPSPLNAVYSATKAYVWSFSTALAEELRGTGITVTVLCPGATRTEFQERAHIENVRLMRFGVMEAVAVAEAGYRAMISGRRIEVPGLYSKTQVLLTRLLPNSLMVRMAKAMLQPMR